MDYLSLTIPKLKDIIRSRGLHNYSGKNKAGLVLMLQESDGISGERQNIPVSSSISVPLSIPVSLPPVTSMTSITSVSQSSSVPTSTPILPVPLPMSVSTPVISSPIVPVTNYQQVSIQPSLPSRQSTTQSTTQPTQQDSAGVRMVRLKCVREKGKLRVKIDSDEYIRGANCRFPRDMRADGREFLVPSSDVSLSAGRAGKFFYVVKKGNISIAPPGNTSSTGSSIRPGTYPAPSPVSLPGSPSAPSVPLNIKVYESEDNICAVCMDRERDTVSVPCGHKFLCYSCSNHIFNGRSPKCPICRTVITQLVNRSDIEGE